MLQPLTGLLGQPSSDLLVGLSSADDAAVYRINETQAIVATTDFFPPIVDDPWTFGAIAAANALSDIYAMGGDPLFCLNLVAFPDSLDLDILTQILRGGLEKVQEAGSLIAGGHTVTDDEPKYGLAAIGIVHPDRIFHKGGIQVGDTLILTKPIGTGVITTALKEESVSEANLIAATSSMLRLNATPARILREMHHAVHACTDVTGFGLLGHALEMAQQSGVCLRLSLADIPLLPGARDYAAEGIAPGGVSRNIAHMKPHTRYAEHVSPTDRVLLNDPQTSGGLLVAVRTADLDAIRARFAEAGVLCAVIGDAVAGSGIVVE